jgi:predicted NBD/HSP70 family sugar kinase
MVMVKVATGIGAGIIVHESMYRAAGDIEAGTTLARRAGRFIGRTLSEVVSLLNPSVVVIGGELAAGSDYLIAGIREILDARSSPLATRTLPIVPARLGNRAGTVGLTSVLTDYLFDPLRVDATFT